VVTARRTTRKRSVESLEREILDAVELVVIATDESGTVTFINRFAEELLGWTLREAVGRHVFEVAPSELSRDATQKRIAQLAKGTRFETQRVLGRRDGSTFEAKVITKPLLDSRGRQVGIVGFSQDISATKQAERRREAQYAVTRALAESTTFAEMVPAVLGAVGGGLGWELGAMWMVDWGAQVLRCVEVWRVSSARYRLFEELTRRMIFPSGVELCGRVWAANDVIWSADLAETLSPPRALVAANDGLQGAIGFPVRTGRGIIGVVTFYAKQIPEPDSDLRAMLEALGSQIGLFTERREAERLESSIVQLRALSRRLVAVREEERARASREFHDELGQSLTGLKLDLAWVGRQLAAMEHRPSNVEDKIREMSSQVDAVIQTVRDVITEMRPRVLDELGLVAAIEWQAGDFRRRSGIRCELGLQVPELELDEARRTAVFRILQEILTNVARHAAATEARVTLRTERQDLLLEVKDNGRGITETEINARTSLGLVGMRERVHACGGVIEFTGAAGVGTTVTVRIPLDDRPL
jgi:PAS domain S-box-containing protein